MNESTELSIEQQATVSAPATPSGAFINTFGECLSLANTLCRAEIVPQNFRNKPADTAIAIDIANRMDVSPIMVMQNLYVVKGKPSWSGQACMSFLRNKYEKVKVCYVGEKGTDSRGCYIKAVDKDGDVLEGTTITISMAKAEGWTSNPKWRNMPEQMLAYRAATFFARVHCPEILMGCQVEEEAEYHAQREPVKSSLAAEMNKEPEKTFEERIDGMVQAFEKLGVSAEMILNRLGKAISEMSQAEFKEYLGIYKQIASKKAEISDFFPADEPESVIDVSPADAPFTAEDFDGLL
jgi:hypothetical protein